MHRLWWRMAYLLISHIMLYHILYTLWTIKRWQNICDRNSGKSWWIFYNFCTVVNRRKRFTHIWQKCPPHLINVLMLPSENENITFHTFIIHSLNITRCIKLNDRPDGIIHWIEVWWVPWPHVWSYGLSFSNVCMRPKFMTSMSCDSVYCMCGAA